MKLIKSTIKFTTINLREIIKLKSNHRFAVPKTKIKNKNQLQVHLLK